MLLACLAFVAWLIVLLLQVPEVCTPIGHYIMNEMDNFWVHSLPYAGKHEFTAFENLAEATCNVLSSTCCSDALLDMLESVLHNYCSLGAQSWVRPLNYLLRLHENQFKERQQQLLDMVQQQLEEFLAESWDETYKSASGTPVLLLIQQGLDMGCTSMSLLLHGVKWNTIHPLEAAGLVRALLSRPQPPAASVAHNNDFLARLTAHEPKPSLGNGYTVVEFDVASLPADPGLGENVQLCVLDSELGPGGNWRIVVHTSWQATKASWGIHVGRVHVFRLVDGVVHAWDIWGEGPNLADLLQAVCVCTVWKEK